jgi:hypothetical protein
MDRFGLDGSVDLLMRHEAVGITWPEIVARAVARCHDHGRTVLAVDGWDKVDERHRRRREPRRRCARGRRTADACPASGLAVLIVAHQRKSRGEFGEGVRGSSAYERIYNRLPDCQHEPNMFCV